MQRSSRVAAKQVIAAANLAFESSSSKHRTMTSLAASSSCPEQQMQRRQQQQHHSHHMMNPSVTSAAAASIITPPPSPQLLLEGDEMYISSDGKSHTYYRLHHAHHHPASIEYLLEEAYDIENARKEITLLQQPSFSNDDNCNDTEMNMSTPSKPTTAAQQPRPLSKIFSFPLQEINNGIQKGVGTGCTTWDSSIVMGLYFGMYPQELLVGKDVLELGSGVGLGGILARVVSKRCEKNISISNGEEDSVKFTLSEVNRDIINMLRYNTTVAAAANASSGLLESDELHIEQMDWFDFLVGGTNVQDHHSSTTAATNTARKKYDTIIASDCIYLPSQIKPLSETIAKLLASDNPKHQKAHIFSPYNRGFIQDLIHELREGKNMVVHVETIEMSKFRVKYTESENVNMSRLNRLLGEEDEPKKYERQDVVSSCTSKFLHITASFKNDGVKESDSSDESMTSID
ncbi:hypothetical protein QTG54_008971 [Skeletonema marinoi]|uniref:Calmodulin-lysine N-methyltransferase n=1 Tax=Skeletonema marinoi TaxID=267567 RepID=A0AAD9DAB0_9STRA|nr:hypothetical protein QTG54_008971 [Skeletonema marinoi]